MAEKGGTGEAKAEEIKVEPTGTNGAEMPSEEPLTDEEIEWQKQHANWSPIRMMLLRFFGSPRFEILLCCIILLNLLLLIVEADSAATGETVVWVEVINNLILAFFTCEISVQIFIHRSAVLYDPWRIFDLTIVCTELSFIILSAAIGGFPSITMLRLVRLLRISRTRLVLDKVPELGMIIQCLLGAARPLVWGIVICTFLLVVFSLLAVQLIHPLAEKVAENGGFDGCERCPRAYRSVWQSSITFSQQILAGDSWGQATIPIMEYYPPATLFFAIVFISMEVAAMNVILAAIVDSASQARAGNEKFLAHEKDQELEEARKRLTKICKDIDKDKSGTLTKDELEHGFLHNTDCVEIMKAMDIRQSDIDTIWAILDADASGDLDYDEFVDQLFKMKTSDSHMMLVFIKHYVLEIRKQLEYELKFLKGQVMSSVKDVIELELQVLKKEDKISAEAQNVLNHFKESADSLEAEQECFREGVIEAKSHQGSHQKHDHHIATGSKDGGKEEKKDSSEPRMADSMKLQAGSSMLYPGTLMPDVPGPAIPSSQFEMSSEQRIFITRTLVKVIKEAESEFQVCFKTRSLRQLSTSRELSTRPALPKPLGLQALPSADPASQADQDGSVSLEDSRHVVNVLGVIEDAVAAVDLTARFNDGDSATVQRRRNCP